MNAIRSRRTRTAALTLALAGLSPAAGEAQEPAAPIAELDPVVARTVVAFYNASSTVRLLGDAVLPAGRTLVGDVAVLGATLEVGGRIEGDVVVINGRLALRPGAAIEGAVTTVGSVVEGQDSARIAGGLVSHPEPLRYHLEADRIVYTPPEVEGEIAAGREFGFGRTDFTVAVQRGYNRVEGLPIAAGPRIRLGDTNPTEISGRVIYRTAGGLSLDEEALGYTARVEQAIGGHERLSLWVSARSEIAPIETRGLTDRENSLSTFVLHRDYRDHYEREGWSTGLTLTPRRSPMSLSLAYNDEHHDPVPAASPLSLFDNQEDWRPQPAVATGDLQSLALRFRYDSRNEEEMPSSGWYAVAEIEQGIGGELVLPIGPDGSAPATPLATTTDFTAGSLDIRRYARLGRRSRLMTRVLAAGSLADQPLPAQRQHVLGGEGTLPGYEPLSFDCGARERPTGAIGEDPFFPYYGCDRAVLVQLEYEALFPLGSILRRYFGAGVDLTNAAAWVLFFDAGRAWTELAEREGRGGGQDDFAADAGLGFRIGRLGVYWAFPLTGSGQGVN
ncbi:MAG: BamA/TamA family outer membrane protein, partial [Longimicrobiales bacterium]